ncbi:NAD-dependent epimerase/dehydratase family protein [Spirosoma aerolatum]|uniref:NAD-dependent epimerase/dehydratase family protein n=1 Tax=Spirosoma aerolatum TaxID=1211326 RepID=UPI0009AF0412|nr:NAD-dependent epimerase/dehydratase family protein [Spirosoma aerolatum]
MNVLITGGAGFIGSHVADHLLAMGCRVHVLDNFHSNYSREQKLLNIRSGMSHPAYYLHEGDIRDATRLTDLFRQNPFDVVVHLAALPGVQASLQRPDVYTDVNINGTRTLLNVMHQFGVRKLIFGSSSSVYGDHPAMPLQEDCQHLFPISPYALTKYKGEQLCRQYHEQYGMEITCLRFFTVYGPRQRPDMAIYQFLEAIRQQHPLTIYGKGTSRDYTYVADIVQGISKAMFRIDGFAIYNIGSGSYVSLRQLITLMESVSNQKALIIQKPDRPGDVAHTWADLTLSKQNLTYQPTTSLSDGLQQMVDWLASRNAQATLSYSS